MDLISVNFVIPFIYYTFVSIFLDFNYKNTQIICYKFLIVLRPCLLPRH